MAKSKNKYLRTILLLPLSKLYGMVTYVRNKFFDWGFLKQTEFNIPIVVVGNISVGGTGKTPHVEYIIDALRFNYKIGVLSRGYKRRTKGFVLASEKSTPEEIGDESYQIYSKYGKDVTVAVCESRVDGINELLRIDKNINLIVLDDAFQHRYVKPTVAIVLTEYNRPVYQDKMLPYGRLRESVSALNRADMVVVTKCPDAVKPMDYRIYKNNLKLFPYQKLYYSKYTYGHLQSVFPENTNVPPMLDWLTEKDSLLVVSGIANPRPLIKHIKHLKCSARILKYPDHHEFSAHDIAEIKDKFKALKGEKCYILTTEKDAVKFKHNKNVPDELKKVMYYIPVNVRFISLEDVKFENDLQKLIVQNMKSNH